MASETSADCWENTLLGKSNTLTPVTYTAWHLLGPGNVKSWLPLHSFTPYKIPALLPFGEPVVLGCLSHRLPWWLSQIKLLHVKTILVIRSLAFWARARDPVWSFANLGACLGSLSLGAQEPPWWVTEPPLSPSSCPSSLSRRTGSCAVCASRGHPWLTLHGGVLGLCRLEPSLSVYLSVRTG